MQLETSPQSYSIPGDAFGVEFEFAAGIDAIWPGYVPGGPGTVAVLVGANWDENVSTTWNMAQKQWGFAQNPETYVYPVVNSGWGEAGSPGGGTAQPAIFGKCFTNNDGFESGSVTLNQFTIGVTISYLTLR